MNWNEKDKSKAKLFAKIHNIEILGLKQIETEKACEIFMGSLDDLATALKY